MKDAGLSLVEKHDGAIPEYAILLHTWELRKSRSKTSRKALARIRLATKRSNSAENKPPATVFYISGLTHVASTRPAASSLVKVCI